MRKNDKHLTASDRKIIAEKLKDPKIKCKDIAAAIMKDPTTISREILRNRELDKRAGLQNHFPNSPCGDCINAKNCRVKHVCGSVLCRKHTCKFCSEITIANNLCKNYKKFACKKTEKFPFVCNGCRTRGYCSLPHFYYVAEDAESYYKTRLVASRNGIDMSEEEFNYLDSTLKNRVALNQSIYHIVKSDDNITKSPKTIYKYINDGLLSVKKIDLIRAVKLKQRKKVARNYEYKENRQINREGHEYIDYKVYVLTHPIFAEVQFDFLGKPKGTSGEILSMTIAKIEFMMLFYFDQKSCENILKFFNNLDRKLGRENFKKLFPVMLTDRDPAFNCFRDIEFDENGEQRTKIFFCNPGASHQKPNIENVNGQLRLVFPKKKNLNHLTQQILSQYNSNFNSRILASLVGTSPSELFIKIYGQDIFNKLGLEIIKPEDVNLKEF